MSEYENEIKWIVQAALECSDFFKTHLVFSEVKIFFPLCKECFASLFLDNCTRIFFHYILFSSVCLLVFNNSWNQKNQFQEFFKTYIFHSKVYSLLKINDYNICIRNSVTLIHFILTSYLVWMFWPTKQLYFIITGTWRKLHW